MFIHQEPPPPREEILKLEKFLDELEPGFPPANPTEDNPLDINHFDLLGWIASCAITNEEGERLTRHYLNACRQIVAAERYIAKVDSDVLKLETKAKELEERMAKLEAADGKVEESAPEVSGVPV
jgi:hypothetical protein